MSNKQCHTSFLPISEKSKVQLARCGSTIYKFKIIQNDYLKQLLQDWEQLEIQKQLEKVIDYLLRVYTPDYPKELVVTTADFAVRIKTTPWFLSNILVFYNHRGKFSAGDAQFILSLEKRSVKNVLSSDTRKGDDETKFSEELSFDKSDMDLICKGQSVKPQKVMNCSDIDSHQELKNIRHKTALTALAKAQQLPVFDDQLEKSHFEKKKQRRKLEGKKPKKSRSISTWMLCLVLYGLMVIAMAYLLGFFPSILQRIST